MLTPARAAIAAALAAVLLGMSGCAVKVPGVDGNLVDDWQPMAAPAFQLPTAGTCLDRGAQPSYNPSSLLGARVECDRPHSLEVVMTGTVEGNAAQASEPPAEGSEEATAAYASCSKAVTDYVGGDWHTGMLAINVQLPNRTPWGGGLRTYVCSVYALSDIYGSSTNSLAKTSLKGSLTGAAPQALRCIDVNGDKGKDNWWGDIRALTQIDCAQPHEAEFVGVVQVGAGVGGALPSLDLLEKWTTDRCWPAIAKYLGLTESQLDTRTDMGMAWDGFSKADWEAGERTQRCFALFVPGKKAKASIKGLGKKALPV
ncbi:septum formation family protein [Dactylosporangium sp. NPDC000521]|uniref:septum formation family protein n=1 Tax=Dactylosporangium sp. NPDC000521 TaxID=3363975 RepID=UPI0036B4389D